MKKKKILVLTPRLPFPLIGGDKLRIYNICKVLYKQSYQITLISFVENKEEYDLALSHPDNYIFDEILPVVLPKFRSLVNSFFGIFDSSPFQINYYSSKKMQKIVNNEVLNGDYDCTLVHLIRMAPYVMNLPIPKILEMTDAISLNYKRNNTIRSFNLFSIIYKAEMKRVQQFEIEAIKKFNHSVVVSEVDKQYLIRLLPEKYRSNLLSISNGVSYKFLSTKNPVIDENLIVFIGNLRSYQNRDAVFHFVKDIWPVILTRRPQTKLKIIGANPPKSLKRLSGSGNIEVTGKVESVINEAKTGSVSVAPIRIGAGIQNKVLESMALEIAVVSSKIAAEGIDFIVPNEHYLVAESCSEFANDVIKLLDNKSLRIEITKKAKQVIVDNFTWDKMLEKYFTLIPLSEPKK